MLADAVGAVLETATDFVYFILSLIHYVASLNYEIVSRIVESAGRLIALALDVRDRTLGVIDAFVERYGDFCVHTLETLWNLVRASYFVVTFVTDSIVALVAFVMDLPSMIASGFSLVAVAAWRLYQYPANAFWTAFSSARRAAVSIANNRTLQAPFHALFKVQRFVNDYRAELFALVVLFLVVYSVYRSGLLRRVVRRGSLLVLVVLDRLSSLIGRLVRLAFVAALALVNDLAFLFFPYLPIAMRLHRWLWRPFGAVFSRFVYARIISPFVGWLIGRRFGADDVVVVDEVDVVEPPQPVPVDDVLPRGRAGPTRRVTRASASRAAALQDESDDRLLCVVCCDREKTVLTMPCRHLCLCRTCADLVAGRNQPTKLCPVCRTRIASLVDVYL